MKRFMIAVLFMLASVTVYADNFVEVGADVAFYDTSTADTDLSNNFVLNARWGTLGDTGLYAWGSYEQPNVTFDTLTVSRVKTFGVGGGLRVPFDNGLYAFTELGYYMPSSGKGIDVKYDGNFGGTLGLGYDITENFTANVNYRFLKLDVDTPEFSSVGDMTAINIGVSYRF
jgi:opacity protein-like surface antigen